MKRSSYSDYLQAKEIIFKVTATLTKPFCRPPIDTCIKQLDMLVPHDCTAWHDVSWALK